MGVSFLLDTHCVAWVLGDPSRLPPEVVERLGDSSNEALVSAASAMEASTKTRLGRWDLSAMVEAWSARLSEVGMTEIAIDTSDALLAGSLPWEHRDPFDRLLVAQAIRRNAVLVTVDRTILALPGVRTLTW